MTERILLGTGRYGGKLSVTGDQSHLVLQPWLVHVDEKSVFLVVEELYLCVGVLD